MVLINCSTDKGFKTYQMLLLTRTCKNGGSAITPDFFTKQELIDGREVSIIAFSCKNSKIKIVLLGI